MMIKKLIVQLEKHIKEKFPAKFYSNRKNFYIHVGSAIDCAAYNTFHSVSSDQKIVTIKYRLCFRTNKSRKYSPKFD